jgi:hypothetical protein
VNDITVTVVEGRWRRVALVTDAGGFATLASNAVPQFHKQEQFQISNQWMKQNTKQG